jgi:hypothetical protein
MPITLGADKGYNTSDFVMELRDKAVTLHVAQNQIGHRRPHYSPSRLCGFPADPQARRRGLRVGQDG